MADLKNFFSKFDKTYEALQNEFATVRAGRANPRILDKVTVDYYGSKSPLSQIATISVPEARMIAIQPWDKTAIKEIEKAINLADIGINPTNDGSVIRLVFPELNEDRRKELTKEIKKTAENYKVSIRNTRKEAIDFIKKLEKDKLATEDDTKKDTDELQKQVDKIIEKIDKLVEDKTKELMTV